MSELGSSMGHELDPSQETFSNDTEHESDEQERLAERDKLSRDELKALIKEELTNGTYKRPPSSRFNELDNKDYWETIESMIKESGGHPEEFPIDSILTMELSERESRVN